MKIIAITLLLLSNSAFSLEKRKKIAVIDTGVTLEQSKQPFMCENGVRSALNRVPSGLVDLSSKEYVERHGENVIGLITKTMDSKKYCIFSVKYDHNGDIEGWIKALNMVNNEKGVIWVNLSLATTSEEEPNAREIELLKNMNERGVGFSVAAGNLGINLNERCLIFPACNYRVMPNKSLFRVIGNLYATSSNIGYPVRDWEFGTLVGVPVMSGTSQATAIYTGKMFSK